MMQTLLFKEPVVGLPIGEPMTSPRPGDFLLGYKIIEKEAGMFRHPAPSDMTMCGWLSVGVLAIIFWPISCLPCCMTCAYPDSYQVPVYGQ